MEGGDQQVVFRADDVAADAADGGFVVGEVAVGGAAEGHDDPGTDDLDLAQEIGAAGEGFGGGGDPVAGGAALDDVGDVDLLAAEVEDVFDHPGQELARPADEGAAGAVLRRSRSFAHEHQPRVRVPFSENHLVATLGQVAEVAPLHQLPQGVQVAGELGRFGLQV